MDLNAVRSNVARLAEIVDGWQAPEKIDAIERDLVLEKLRGLYDEVLLAGSEGPVTLVSVSPDRVAGTDDSAVFAASDAPAEEANPVVLDLGEMLSLDTLPEEYPVAEEPQLGVAADEPAIAAAAAEPVEPAEPAEPAAESVAEAAAESAPEPAAPESAVSEPVAPADPEPKEEHNPEQKPAPASKSRPVYAAPTLFGPEEEELMRHRHKQRVIMSLYDTEPQPAAPRPAASEKTVFEKSASQKSVSEKSAPEKPAAEKFVSEDAAPESSMAESAEPSVENASVTTAKNAPVAESAEPPFAAAGSLAKAGPSSVAESVVAETSVPAGESVDPSPAAGITAPGETEVVSDAAPAASVESADPAAVAEPGPGTELKSEPEPEPMSETSASVAAPRQNLVSSTAESAAGPAVSPASDAVPAGAVLGEVINHDVQTLADRIAPPRDRASELRRKDPVTDLRKAIGINDKFLMIRDLFGGDGASFEIAVRALNGFDNLDDCMIYIAENYAWNANSDGAKLLMELLERKFA